MKFTQASIRMKMPESKTEHIEFDEGMPGFGLRIRASGKREHRTFIAQYKIGSQHRRVTIGNALKITLEDARAEARKIFGKVAHGKDPQGEKVAARADASNTLGATVAAYLDVAKQRQRLNSYQATERHLNKLWRPLHGLAASAVSRAVIAARMATIAKENGPVTANRARTTLSTMFRWAIGEELCESNPVIGSNRQQENGPRERSLSDAEAASVYLACADNDYGRIVRLLLLTGCRRDEIGSLRWSELDLEGRTITLPAQRTKNKQIHVVPLCDAALKILQAIPRQDRELVFGRTSGAGFGGWSQSKRLFDTKVKLDEPWTVHDLRRTVRTGLGMLKVAPHVAEAVLNHLPAKLIRTYDQNQYEPEKRAAIELWANHLAVAIAQASGANVTSLRKA